MENPAEGSGERFLALNHCQRKSLSVSSNASSERLAVSWTEMVRNMLLRKDERRRVDSLSPGTRAPKRDALHASDGSDERLAMVLRGLQHHLNALHVMARFVRLGLPQPRALALAHWWERLIHPLLYPTLRQLIPVRVASPEQLRSVPGAATRDRAKGTVS